MFINFKGTRSQIGTKKSFPSNASKSTYFIIIILFDIEIEHRNTKKRKKKCMPLVGFEPTPVNQKII